MAAPAAILNILVQANTAQATASLTKLQTQLNATAATANKSTGATAAKLKTFGKVGALAVGAIGFASVKAAADFESSFAEVRKTVDASEKRFGKLETGIRNMAKSIPITASELSELAGQAGALGIKSKDLLKFTKTAAELGIATDLSADQAANALARLSNIMGTSSKDFRRLGSTMVELGNRGASTESEIAEMALRIAGAGKQIGLTESEVLSFGSALASVGIRAEAGGSAITRAFITMAEAVDKGGGDLSNFAKVAGMSSGKFADAFEKDAAGAMLSFLEGLDGIRKSGGSVFSTLEKLELNEIRVRDALLRASGAGKLFSDQLKIGSEEWKRNSALTEEASRRYDTTAAKFQVFKNRVNDLFITIGQKLLPVVNDLLDFLGVDFPREVEEAVESVKKLWRESGVLRAVLKSLLDTAKKVWSGIADIIEGAAKIIQGAVKIITGILTGNFGRAWDGVKDIFKGGVKAIVGVIKAVTAPIRGAAKLIGSALASVFGGAWDKIKNIFQDGANALKDIVNWIISNVINRIPGVELDTIAGSGSTNAPGGNRKKGGGVDPNPGRGIGRHARGGKVTTPTAIVGEEAPQHPEFVIATNPAYRKRNMGLWMAAGKTLGMPGFALGGVLGDAITNSVGGVFSGGGSNIPSPGDLISKLAGAPFGALPDFMGGTGEYVKDKFADFIRDKLSGLVEGAASGLTGGMKGVSVPKGGSTLSYAAALQKMFGLSFTSGYRSPEANAAAGGVPNSLHTHGSPSNPGAFDMVGSSGAMSKGRAYAQKKWNPIESLIHDAGSGLHLHLGFFKKGGILQKLAKGGVLNPSGMASLMLKRGLGSAQARIMGAIGMAESSGNQRAVGDGGQSHSAWQIFKPAWPQFSVKKLMSNWKYAADAAIHVLKTQGLGAWSVYNSGAYRQFLDEADPIASSGRGGGGSGGKSEKKKRVKFGLGKSLNQIARLDEMIDLAGRTAAFPSSPAGEELSGKESHGLIKLNRRLLGKLVDRRGILRKALRSKGLGRDRRGSIKDMLAEVQGVTGKGGRIFDVKETLTGLRTGDIGSVAESSAARADLLSEKVRDLSLRLAVSQAQYKVFKGMPYGGSFAGGGVVPGPVGSAQRIIAHGGETVSNGPPFVIQALNIYSDGRVGMVYEGREFEMAVERVNRKQSRRGDRRLPGRAGATR